MLHKLSVEDLRVGMTIADTKLSWLNHPYLYAKDGTIANAEELEAIRTEGYLEAFIDLERCLPESLSPKLVELIPGPAPPFETFTPFLSKVSLQEETRVARKIFKYSLSYARQFMDGIRKGIFDLPSAEPVVGDIIGSLDRNSDALVGLCKLLQADDYTYTHCVNVSIFSILFAKGLGVSGDNLHSIGMGGLFHDLGKALIPLRVLNAPRKLNDEEFTIMKRHPHLGYEQLRTVSNVPGKVLQAVIEHHERYDGTGYPYGIAGDQISFAGRVAAVADVFDALSSRRVYKDPMPVSNALSIMYSMRDKAFHPGMVEYFIRLLGVFPIGCPVRLENGLLAVVSASNQAFPLRPKIILVRDAKGKALQRAELDLTAPGAPGISSAITAKELGVDPARVLGFPAL